MKPIKISDKRPSQLLNVFINYELHSQPYWTRAYLVGDTFEVMSWSGNRQIPVDDVKEWMPLPNNWEKQ